MRAARQDMRTALAAAAFLWIGLLTGCASHEATSGNGAASSGPAAGTTSAAPPNAPFTGTAQTVTLKTADGWTLVGDLYVPQGTSKGAVILLHQRGGSGKDWQPLCAALQKAGLTALALDQRGAGRTTQGPGPTGDDAPWDTSGDIAAAIASFGGKQPIGLAGASYGANNALIYAAAHPDQVRGLALFSPGANYHGLDALPAARAYRGPLLIFHDKGDSIADDGPQQINTASPSRDHVLVTFDGSDHGTALLQAVSIENTVTFFTRALKR